jgi:hypothetical protein
MKSAASEEVWDVLCAVLIICSLPSILSFVSDLEPKTNNSRFSKLQEINTVQTDSLITPAQLYAGVSVQNENQGNTNVVHFEAVGSAHLSGPDVICDALLTGNTSAGYTYLFLSGTKGSAPPRSI